MSSIDICIATYQRSSWLQQLLDTLAVQDIAATVRLRAIVVDNDIKQSARAVVQACNYPRLELLYLTQPEKNIALTRNAALDHADADWIALVDDDEYVPVDWLRKLMSCQAQHRADVVFGPVRGHVPPDAPSWVRSGGFFEEDRRPSGTQLPFGASNNALLNRTLVDSGARFDARYGLTGGEDTHFFHALASRGARLVWCQEAMVNEHLPRARLTVGWILRRQFRGGQVFADIIGRPTGVIRQVSWLIKRLGLLVVATLLTVMSIPMGFGSMVRAAGKVASNLGQVSSLFSYRFNEYR